MPILEQIFLKFKVDTTDLKRELKTVEGAEKEAVKKSIELAEARNKSLDRHITSLKTVDLAMQTASRAIDFMGSAWEAYEKKALAAGGADAEKAKSFRASLDKMGEAVNHFMVAVGSLVVKLEPLLKVITAIVDEIASFIEAAGSDRQAKFKEDYYRRHPDARPQSHSQVAYGAHYAERDLMQAIQTVASGIVTAGQIAAGAGIEQARKIQPKQPKRGGGAPIPIEFYREAYAGAGGGGLEGVLGGGEYGQGAGFRDIAAGMSLGEYATTQTAGTQELFASLRAMSETLKHEGAESTLELMFGPIEEFNAYQTAFNSLTNAITSGFEAWMTGADSFANAMKKALAASLTATASELLGQAIKHGAFAIGSLAFGDLKGAAVHGAAAAKFAAGAIAVGSLAKLANSAIGSAGNAGATPSAPNVGGRGAGAEVGGGGRAVTVVIGDSMADDSPRWRARQTARAIRRANRELDQGGGGVVYE